MNLGGIRKKIDALDEKLLRLLQERAELAHAVGVLKKKKGVSIYAPEREEQLLRALAKKNTGRLTEKAIRAIYREIMSASLALEKDLIIAFAGPDAVWSDQAARRKFGTSVEYLPLEGVADVFDAVSRGKADYGVAPIENSAEGAVNQTLDAFVESELKICAQILLRTGKKPIARFLVIGKETCPPTGDDITSLIFCARDKAGGLFAALEPFNRLKINLSKIESRPSKRKAGESLFFMDADGHAREEPLLGALKALGKRASFLKVLGSYPKTNES